MNTPTTLPAWSLRHLQQAARDDLALCRSEFERINVRAICCREIITTAAEYQETRKLTPGEETILESAKLGKV